MLPKLSEKLQVAGSNQGRRNTGWHNVGLSYRILGNCAKKSAAFQLGANLEVTGENVFDIMRGGRARWRIEKETFNTLKNQDFISNIILDMGKRTCQLFLQY